MKKKIHIHIEGENAEEIEKSLKRAARFSNKDLVDNPEEADIILVSTHSSALKMLKENDEALVLVYVFPWIKEDVGVRTLKARYPDRIVICQHFKEGCQPGDKEMVPYLTSLGKK